MSEPASESWTQRLRAAPSSRSEGVPRVDPTRAPEFLVPLLEGVRGVDAAGLLRFRMPPPPEGGRRAAVLMVFAEGPAGPDVLLLDRASTPGPSRPPCARRRRRPGWTPRASSR
jgi:hypothetical protein